QIGFYPNSASYSQFEEDRFFLDYFGDTPGLYLDVGAFHPWRISNTYLLYRHGWKGVTIEPIARLIQKHRQLRPRDIQIHAAAGEGRGQVEFNELVPAAMSTFDPSAARTMIESGHALPFRRYPVD